MSTVQSVPLYHGTVWVSLGMYFQRLSCTKYTCTYIYVHCPECLSHPVVPWDSMGILRNVLHIPIRILLHMSAVQSVCPIPLYHGTVWVSLGMYYIYPYVCIYVHCSERLSHPVVPWDSMGILRNVLHIPVRIYIYIYVHCPECLPYPVVPWNSIYAWVSL